MNKIKSINARYPNIGKGIISGMLLSASDAIAQLYIQKIQFDWKRNLQFLGLGLGWLGPCIQTWYSFLLPRITARYFAHMSKPRQVLCRLLVDTLVYSPFTYSGFYIIKDVILRKDRSTINYQQEIRQKFIPTILWDWVLWAPVNYVNFWWIPVHWQGLYVGVFSFFFNVLLSYIANRELQYQKEQAEALSHGEKIPPHKESLEQIVIHKVHPKKIQVIL